MEQNAEQTNSWHILPGIFQRIKKPQTFWNAVLKKWAIPDSNQ
tara:strand:+ start:496 stop:624 length:129 start_codon:yes stop_codon:yes gene_type:complete